MPLPDHQFYCPFSNYTARSFSHVADSPNLSYVVWVEGQPFDITVERAVLTNWDQDPWYSRNGYLVGNAMRNGISLFNDHEVITLALVKQRINSSSIPHTPKMKLDKLMSYIENYSNQQGATIEIVENQSDFNNTNTQRSLSTLLKETYIKNKDELVFYIKTLEENSFIRIHSILNRTTSETSISLTYQGFNYLVSLEAERIVSNNCFVAMSFDESRRPYRNVIEAAITSAGYQPIIVDVAHVDSDQTINDRIIADIRKCKFCVADFTQQRNGIYFEAGFALGLGRPVIYACEKADFDANSHFDLKPFQHVLYDSAEQLGRLLKNKIDAWIQ